MKEQRNTLLILDDEEAIRESLVEYFEDRDWHVVSARSAEAAFEIMADMSPDGAIVDIRLPGMDGNGFIRKVSQSHPRLACIICTGSPEYIFPDDIAALPQVSEELFSKPIDVMSVLEKTLLEMIEKMNSSP